MPQLDIMSWWNQIFWFFFCMIGFYYVLVYWFLVKIIRNFKFKYKILRLHDEIAHIDTLRFLSLFNEWFVFLYSFFFKLSYILVTLFHYFQMCVIRNWIKQYSFLTRDLCNFYLCSCCVSIAFVFPVSCCF